MAWTLLLKILLMINNIIDDSPQAPCHVTITPLLPCCEQGVEHSLAFSLCYALWLTGNSSGSCILTTRTSWCPAPRSLYLYDVTHNASFCVHVTHIMQASLCMCAHVCGPACVYVCVCVYSSSPWHKITPCLQVPSFTDLLPPLNLTWVSPQLPVLNHTV
jgi:hypothetical protein